MYRMCLHRPHQGIVDVAVDVHGTVAGDGPRVDKQRSVFR